MNMIRKKAEYKKNCDNIFICDDNFFLKMTFDMYVYVSRSWKHKK